MFTIFFGHTHTSHLYCAPSKPCFYTTATTFKKTVLIMLKKLTWFESQRTDGLDNCRVCKALRQNYVVIMGSK